VSDAEARQSRPAAIAREPFTGWHRAVERLNEARAETQVIEAGVASARDFAAFQFAAVTLLREALPDLRIIVGRWSPASLADESTQALTDAGATLVATTIVETREYLAGLVEIVRVPAA